MLKLSDIIEADDEGCYFLGICIAILYKSILLSN